VLAVLSAQERERFLQDLAKIVRMLGTMTPATGSRSRE
jgi:hypothetical protein